MEDMVLDEFKPVDVASPLIQTRLAATLAMMCAAIAAAAAGSAPSMLQTMSNAGKVRRVRPIWRFERSHLALEPFPQAGPS